MMVNYRITNRLKMKSLEVGIKNISKSTLSLIGMLIHGSKPTLGKRRMGIAVNYCQTSIRMDPMKYTKSIAFTEDFRQPVLVSGRDYYGTLRYVKTLEEMQDEARPKRKKFQVSTVKQPVIVAVTISLCSNRVFKDRINARKGFYASPLPKPKTEL